MGSTRLPAPYEKISELTKRSFRTGGMVRSVVITDRLMVSDKTQRRIRFWYNIYAGFIFTKVHLLPQVLPTPAWHGGSGPEQ